MTPLIRVMQTHDGDGNPAPAESVIELTLTPFEAISGLVRDTLRPWNPTTTENPGVYSYAIPGASGWLRLEGAGSLDVARTDELIRLMEIERTVGSDPLPGTELGNFSPLVIHQRNPYAQIIIGVVFAILAVAVGVQPLFIDPAAEPLVLALPVMALVVLGGAVGIIVIGARRVRWWRRARAEAKRAGGTLPDDLTMLG